MSTVRLVIFCLLNRAGVPSSIRSTLSPVFEMRWLPFSVLSVLFLFNAQSLLLSAFSTMLMCPLYDNQVTSLPSAVGYSLLEMTPHCISLALLVGAFVFRWANMQRFRSNKTNCFLKPLGLTSRDFCSVRSSVTFSTVFCTDLSPLGVFYHQFFQTIIPLLPVYFVVILKIFIICSFAFHKHPSFNPTFCFHASLFSWYYFIFYNFNCWAPLLLLFIETCNK